MNSTNTPDVLARLLGSTPAGSFWHESPPWVHVLIIIVLAVAVRFLVAAIHKFSDWLINKSHAKKTAFRAFQGVAETPRFITITRLIVSAITFVIYFVAVGIVLIEVFHLSDNVLKTYLSSAAVIGLALSFGLQGLVQDVVTGVTLIFSDALDVGDIVDLSGVVGRVEKIGLRFTKVINFFNQEIYVPNRNIGNVARYPREGFYAYADVQIGRSMEQKRAEDLVAEVAKGVWRQFGAIILDEPKIGKIEDTAPGGWNFLRVQFKIWPGQTLIETVFRPQLITVMKQLDPNYTDWMVPVTYRAISSTHDRANLGEGMKAVSLS